MTNNDYVLGTDADEIERLGLQHRVWRDLMLTGWQRAGLCAGMSVIDVGAGPGFATADLAHLVGSEGRVIALERSARFIGSLTARIGAQGLGNVEARVHDVGLPFGVPANDAAWCRWVLSFVADPAATVGHIAAALKPGGIAIFHEYADYATWRAMPPSPDLERFCELVMRSWRDSGGEPDIALELPQMLDRAGFDVVSARPLIAIIDRTNDMWHWPAGFVAVNSKRLAALGYVTPSEAERLATTINRLAPGARMITPLVAELIVRKR